jgi:hypothetical protein
MWRGTGRSGGYDYWLARRSVGGSRAVYKARTHGLYPAFDQPMADPGGELVTATPATTSPLSVGAGYLYRGVS